MLHFIYLTQVRPYCDTRLSKIVFTRNNLDSSEYIIIRTRVTGISDNSTFKAIAYLDGLQVPKSLLVLRFVGTIVTDFILKKLKRIH